MIKMLNLRNIMKKIIYFLSFIFTLFSLSIPTWGESSSGQDIRVGVIVAPPYVIKTGNKYSGVAIDIWTLIASKANLQYHYILHPNSNYNDAVNDVSLGKYDVLVGPISVTEQRIRQVDYTLPFYLDHIGILFLRSEFGYLRNLLVTLFYTVGFLAAILILIFFLHIHILWYAERRNSPKLGGSYINGLEKIFWGYVSEGKYIDQAKSWKGKIALIIWLFIIYILLTIIHGSIISFMTVSWYQYAYPAQSIPDLESERVAADRGTRTFHLARELGLNVREVSSLHEGISLLKKKQVDAYIVPSTEAENYLQDHQEFEVILSPATLHNDIYYFVTQINSPLRRIIDIHQAELHKENLGVTICSKYLTHRARNCNL